MSKLFCLIFLFAFNSYYMNGQKKEEFDYEKHSKCILYKRIATKMKRNAQNILEKSNKYNFYSSIDKSKLILKQAIEIKKLQKEINCDLSKWDTLEIIEYYLWLDDFKNPTKLLNKIKGRYSQKYFENYFSIKKKVSKYDELWQSKNRKINYRCGFMTRSERESNMLKKVIVDCTFINEQKDYRLLIDYLNNLPIKIKSNSNRQYWKVLNQFLIRGLLTEHTKEEILEEMFSNSIIVMKYDSFYLAFPKHILKQHKLQVFGEQFWIEDNSNPNFEQMNNEERINYIKTLTLYQELIKFKEED